MKNVMIIDKAENCSYDIFAIPDHEFKIIFPQEGQDIEFAEDLYERVPPEVLDQIMKDLWTRRQRREEIVGLHGTIFYELAHVKRKYYPTKRSYDIINSGAFD